MTLNTIRKSSRWFRTALLINLFVTATIFISVQSGLCEGSDVNDGMAELIELLQQKGVINEAEAGAIFQRIGQAPTETNEIPTHLIEQLLQNDRQLERQFDELDIQVREEIAAEQRESSWAQRIKLKGDFRLRGESEMYDKNNAELVDPDDQSQLVNTTKDRNRMRYRARFGLDATILERGYFSNGELTAGLRIASGNSDNPVSTNQTMGDYFQKDELSLDRAFMEWNWRPAQEKWGKIPEMSITGGRMPNPFFSTDLLWDSDLNFEGISLKLTTDTQALEIKPWRLFLTAGVFPLGEVELRSSDKWLFGGQLGVKHRIGALTYTLAGAYYQFENITVESPLNDETEMDTIVDWDWSAPRSRQKGNSWALINPFYGVSLEDYKSGLSSEFNELNITAKIDIDLVPIHCIFWMDYVQNLGYDEDAITALSEETIVSPTALEEQTIGYSFGAGFGYPEVSGWGQWYLSVAYKYLEADAVVDALTDSDFHGGGTDAEGYIFKLMLGLYENAWSEFRYLGANEIYQDAEDPDLTRLAIDVFQLSVSVEF